MFCSAGGRDKGYILNNAHELNGLQVKKSKIETELIFLVNDRDK